MKALITGVAGQDGTLLSAELLSRGWSVIGTRLSTESLSAYHPLLTGDVRELDVIDAKAVTRLISDVKPDVVFHLAGITSVGHSFKEPELTMKVNLGGTQNLVEAIRDSSPQTHLIHAASTEIFDANSGVISESSPLSPKSPYAESKAAAYRLCVTARSEGLKATNAILANHESYLRPTDFVTGKIAKVVARISLGLDENLALGNTDVQKDWSSASDIIDGLIQIAERKFVGDVILASGKSTNLEDIIQAAFNYVGITDWQGYIKTDESLVRANESKQVLIDPSLAHDVLDWRALTPANVWVGQMVQHHLDEISKSNS
jgi:GDPmannose 4,6-dehydratase